jgi:hypothetical protein
MKRVGSLRTVQELVPSYLFEQDFRRYAGGKKFYLENAHWPDLGQVPVLVQESHNYIIEKTWIHPTAFYIMRYESYKDAHGKSSPADISIEYTTVDLNPSISVADVSFTSPFDLSYFAEKHPYLLRLLSGIFVILLWSLFVLAVYIFVRLEPQRDTAGPSDAQKIKAGVGNDRKPQAGLFKWGFGFTRSILGKFVSDWKNYFQDKERAILFAGFFLLFPLPMYYVLVLGLVPASYTLAAYLVSFRSLVGMQGEFFMLLAALHLLVQIYLVRGVVSFVLVIVDKLSRGDISRRILVVTALLILVAGSFFNIYFTANIAGGGDNFNVAGYLKTFLNH